ATFTFTPDDEGTYQVTVTVTTSDGVALTTDPVVIPVANAIPAPEIIGLPSAAAAGELFTVHAVPHDAGAADTHTYVWSVVRDGVTLFTSSPTGPTFSYTPTFNGVHVVAVTATDNDGGAGTARTAVIVNGAVELASINVPNIGEEGTPV